MNEMELCDDLTIRYANLTTIWNYRKYLLLILSNTRLQLDYSHLNKMLINNCSLFSNNKMIELDQNDLNETNDLIDRELNISKFIVHLYKSMNILNDDLTNLTDNSFKFNQFIKKFLNIYK